ncbi:MAG TPA: PD-(D/E)XK nuclease-like domain-containing protein, partial [Rugosimonospora sp.]|nr:PD-(D/E)XK nuclease-like domain-containing protein [Rugosimonospora sp.]
MTATITEPGVYQIPEDDYHADPVIGGSLSSTGARKLLPPSCPALYRHWADNPEQTSKEFDVGHAAHAQVLGTGPEIAVLDYDSWRTNAVKADAEEARAAGKVPLLAKEHAPLAGMVAALRAHPWTSQILAPGTGVAEQTLIWRDGESGVWCRARLDHIHHRQPGRRLVVVDYKTTVSAAPEDLDRTIYRYGYHVQAAHYLDAVQALGLAPDGVLYLLIFQEKTAPYLPTVV